MIEAAVRHRALHAGTELKAGNGVSSGCLALPTDHS